MINVKENVCSSPFCIVWLGAIYNVKVVPVYSALAGLVPFANAEK